MASFSLLFVALVTTLGLAIGRVQLPRFNPSVLLGAAAGWFALSVALRSTGGIVGVLVIALVGLISTAAYSSSDPKTSTASVLATRVFRTQADGLQFIYQTLPSKVPFSKGRLLLDDLRGILPGRQEGLSSKLPDLRGARSLNNPVGVVSKFYLNFGPYGMAFAMSLFGAGTYCYIAASSEFEL